MEKIYLQPIDTKLKEPFKYDNNLDLNDFILNHFFYFTESNKSNFDEPYVHINYIAKRFNKSCQELHFDIEKNITEVQKKILNDIELYSLLDYIEQQ